MDMYIKQLLTEIGQKAKALTALLENMSALSKKAYSDIAGHAADYEKYYQLVKTSDDEKVSPGHLPFSVYTRQEPSQPSSKEEGDASEKISNILDDRKKVFNRNLQTLKTKALSVEQGTDEFIDLMKDLQDYYEDLIEGVKF